MIFQNCNENIAKISALKVFIDRNPSNIFVAILENQCLYRFVLRLSDLYLLQVCNFSKSHLNWQQSKGNLVQTIATTAT